MASCWVHGQFPRHPFLHLPHLPHLNQHHRTCLSCPEWGKASWRSDLVELSTQMQNSIHSSLWFYKPVRDLSCASNRSKQDHRSAVKKLPASLAKKQNKCYSHPSWERKMWSTSAPGRSPVAEPYFKLRGLTGHSPTLPLNSQSNLNQQPLVCQKSRAIPHHEKSWTGHFCSCHRLWTTTPRAYTSHKPTPPKLLETCWDAKIHRSNPWGNMTKATIKRSIRIDASVFVSSWIGPIHQVEHQDLNFVNGPTLTYPFSGSAWGRLPLHLLRLTRLFGQCTPWLVSTLL